MPFSLIDFARYYLNQFSAVERKQMDTILKIHGSVWNVEDSEQQSSENRTLQMAADESVPPSVPSESFYQAYWTNEHSMGELKLENEYIRFLKILNDYEQIRHGRSTGWFNLLRHQGRLNDPVHSVCYFLKERLKSILSGKVCESTPDELDKLYDFIEKIIKKEVFSAARYPGNATIRTALWNAAKLVKNQIKPLILVILQNESSQVSVKRLCNNTQFLFSESFLFLVYSFSDREMPDGLLVEDFQKFLKAAKIEPDTQDDWGLLLDISTGGISASSRDVEVVRELFNVVEQRYNHGLRRNFSGNADLMKKYTTAICLLQELKNFKHNFELLKNCVNAVGNLCAFGFARDELIFDLYQFRLFLISWRELISKIYELLNNEYMESVVQGNIPLAWKKNVDCAFGHYKGCKIYLNKLAEQTDRLFRRCAEYTTKNAEKDAKAARDEYLRFRAAHYRQRQNIIQHLYGTAESTDWTAVANDMFTPASASREIARSEAACAADAALSSEVRSVANDMVKSFASREIVRHTSRKFSSMVSFFHGNVNKHDVLNVIRGLCEQQCYQQAVNYVQAAMQKGITWDIRSEIQDRIYPLFKESKTGLEVFLGGVILNLLKLRANRHNSALSELVSTILTEADQSVSEDIRSIGKFIREELNNDQSLWFGLVATDETPAVSVGLT